MRDALLRATNPHPRTYTLDDLPLFVALNHLPRERAETILSVAERFQKTPLQDLLRGSSFHKEDSDQSEAKIKGS